MLETLIRLYYARHSFDQYDHWVSFTLVITGNLAASTLSSAPPDSPASLLDGYRSTLVLSARGLQSQAAHYHLAALLSIQLQAAVEPQTLQLVRMYVRKPTVEGEEEKLRVEHSFSAWPVPIIGVHEDPDKVRLKNLLREFEEEDGVGGQGEEEDEDDEDE